MHEDDVPTDMVTPEPGDYDLSRISDPECRDVIRAVLERQAHGARKMSKQTHRIDMADKDVKNIAQTARETKALVKWVLALVVGGGALQAYTTMQIAATSANHTNTTITVPTQNTNTNTGTFSTKKRETRTRAAELGGGLRQQATGDNPYAYPTRERVTNLPSPDCYGPPYVAGPKRVVFAD